MTPSPHPRPPRLLIEDWLPAAAIGVECMRERGTGQNPPNARLHVWWARRPLTVSRAAVLASLLPADFPRDMFERLLGFAKPSKDILRAQRAIEEVRERIQTARQEGREVQRVVNPQGERAFKNFLRDDDLRDAHEAARMLWGPGITVIDPMAGGGSIPLESARLGFHTLANEYNPVACSVLEPTVDYPFRLGQKLAKKAQSWGQELRKRFNARMESLYPKTQYLPPHCYIFARTVPCPDTQLDTPLVPDWHLLKPKKGNAVVAEPVVDETKVAQASRLRTSDILSLGRPGSDMRRDAASTKAWSVRIREVGRGAGQLREPPRPTYSGGKGVSLFTGRQIPSDYIKAKAQAGQMRSALYAVVIKKPAGGLTFQPPEPADLKALQEAEKELARLRPGWEKANIIPTEKILVGDKTGEPLVRGMRTWADMFTPRQLLCLGVLVEELRNLRAEIIQAEGAEMGEAVVHLLAFGIDKFTNYNSGLSFWHPIRGTMANTFDRHDFSFKVTHAEMAACNAGAGLAWAIENVIEPYEKLAALPRAEQACPIEITMGTATSLPQIPDGSITAVVVDPPYADNVQYSELADFFYVWLKRTQGHRRPEWFSTYLCEHEQEAVVNVSRQKAERGVRNAECGVANPKSEIQNRGRAKRGGRRMSSTSG